TPGAIAAVMAVSAVLWGKVVVIYFFVQNSMGAVLAENHTPTDEVMISTMADAIAEQREQAGKDVNWPDAVDDEAASIELAYPPDIWKEAQERWTALAAD